MQNYAWEVGLAPQGIWLIVLFHLRRCNVTHGKKLFLVF